MADGRAALTAMFASARSEGRAVLLPYLTAGLPDPDSSVEIFAAMAAAGADGFEIGIPYSDPLMDGPTIMEAGERALKRGMTVDRSLDVVRSVVERTGVPVLVMTYVNPVLHRGIDAFFGAAADAGAAGVILADLPVDEAVPFVDAATRQGLGMVLFVAPTTTAGRLEKVVAADPAFVYAIAEVGVTGERDRASVNTASLAASLRERSDVPVVFGVGIASPDQARQAAADGDGVIVGTAIVRRVLDADSARAAIEELTPFVRDLASAVRR